MSLFASNNVTQRIGRSRLASNRDIFDEVDTTSDITYAGTTGVTKHLASTDSTAIESSHDPGAYFPGVFQVLQWLQGPVSQRSSSAYIPHAMKVVIWGAKRSGKTSIIYRWKLDSFIPTVPTIGLLEEAHEHYNSTLRCNVSLNLYEIGRDPVSVEMRAIPIHKSTEYSDYGDNSDASGSDCSETGRSCPSAFKAAQAQRIRKRRRYRTCCSSISQCCKCLFCCRRKERFRAIDFAVQMWSKIVKTANAVVYVVDSSCKVSLLEMFDDLNMILHNDHLKSQNARFLILANKQDVWGAVSALEIEKMLNIPRQMEKRCKVLPCSALTGENLSVALAWLEEWIALQCTSLQLTSSSTDYC